MDFPTIAKAVLSGDIDDSLDKLVKLVRERREIVSRATFFTLKPGDRVRFVATARPHYIAGQLGTLRELRQKKVTVDLDKPAGRFHRGIVTPVTLIEKIPA